MYAHLVGATAEQHILLATTILGGAALTWWLQREDAVAHSTATRYVNLDQFFDGLSAQFVPREGWQVAQDKLSRLVQTTSVAAFSEEFLNLVLCIPDMTEREKIHLFTRGLKASTRKEVMVRQCQTLDEAMVVADRVDTVYAEICGWRRGNVSMGKSTGGSSGHTGATPMELGQAKQEFRGHCFNCGEYEHRSSECTKPLACPRGGAGRGRGRGDPGRGTRINATQEQDLQENE